MPGPVMLPPAPMRWMPPLNRTVASAAAAEYSPAEEPDPLPPSSSAEPDSERISPSFSTGISTTATLVGSPVLEMTPVAVFSRTIGKVPKQQSMCGAPASSTVALLVMVERSSMAS